VEVILLIFSESLLEEAEDLVEVVEILQGVGGNMLHLVLHFLKTLLVLQIELVVEAYLFSDSGLFL
jgi:hypothetical protein